MSNAKSTRLHARIALALTISLIVPVVFAWSALGQTNEKPLLTIGVDLVSATSSQATYSLTVTNRGAVGSSGVRVRNVVPDSTTFESSDPAPVPTQDATPSFVCTPGGTREPSGSKCDWMLGSIAPGEHKVVYVLLNLTNQQTDYTVSSTASVTSASPETDSDTDDSLVRDIVDITDDTHVSTSDPASANHGECEYIEVRSGSTGSALVDIDSGMPSDAAIDRVWSAELRSTVENTEYGGLEQGVIGAHRLTAAADWTEGAGPCASGTTGAESDASSGHHPTWAGTSTALSVIDSNAQLARWDVTADLDDTQDRSSFQGWALVDGATAETPRVTSFNSSEGPAESKPKLVLVYAKPEAATCIDVAPEVQASNPSDEPRLAAYVTDGTKVELGSVEACNGAPVASQVVWLIEADSPDLYISYVDDQPTSRSTSGAGTAEPNSVTSTTGPGGATSIHLSLGSPTADSTGTNRVSALIQGSTDVAEPGSSPLCNDQVNPCPGEADNEDDVTMTWAASISPKGRHTPPPPGSGDPSPTFPSGSPTSSPSRIPSSNLSPSPSGSPTSARSPQSLEMKVAEERVTAYEPVTFSGQLSSSDPTCPTTGVTVQILYRAIGAKRTATWASISTGVGGVFRKDMKPTRSGLYIASVPGHDHCARAVAAPVALKVGPMVKARLDGDAIKSGRTMKILGSVKPAHPGTVVVLRRLVGKKKIVVAKTKLTKKSTFLFKLDSKWDSGSFDVLWKTNHKDHVSSSSKAFAAK